MGVSLKDGAIHEGTRVAFVSIADNVLLLTKGISAELPLARCGEASTASAPEAGLCDLFNDSLRCHLQKSFLQCLVPAAVNIVINFLGVNVSAVSQYYALLSRVEFYIRIERYGLSGLRVSVEETLHRLAIAKMGTHDLVGILSLDMGIEDAVGFYDHIGALLAKTVAAGEIHRSICHTLPCHLSLERIADGTGPG
ncbi:hypothetical protein ES703_04898 [subsurface metagenome]